MLENTDRAIKKENPEILATFGTEDTRRKQKKTNNAVCFADLYMQTNNSFVIDD
jgi:hypothetical protein